jgi:dihydroorotate dehydrogenase
METGGMSYLNFALARPILRALDPELAHRLTIAGLRIGLGGREEQEDPPSLRTPFFGSILPNPIGLAAGFDKNGEVPDRMLALGLGFVEIGTVTPRPQIGNPRPRLFRLNDDRAVINRMGFNNDGLTSVVARLTARRGNPGCVGVNIGANKDSEDRIKDYEIGLDAVAPFAAYVVVNISSPNTPGLRQLQEGAALETLLQRLSALRRTLPARPPLFVKIAPDLEADAVREAVEIAIAQGIDGMIISNTTIARPATLKNSQRGEPGGLSGAPLFDPSTVILRHAADAAKGRLYLIGAGGVASGAQARAKLLAGARLVQLYTGLIFEGPDLIRRIKRELHAPAD